MQSKFQRLVNDFPPPHHLRKIVNQPRVGRITCIIASPKYLKDRLRSVRIVRSGGLTSPQRAATECTPQTGWVCSKGDIHGYLPWRFETLRNTESISVLGTLERRRHRRFNVFQVDATHQGHGSCCWDTTTPLSTGGL